MKRFCILIATLTACQILRIVGCQLIYKIRVICQNLLSKVYKLLRHGFQSRLAVGDTAVMSCGLLIVKPLSDEPEIKAGNMTPNVNSTWHSSYYRFFSDPLPLWQVLKDFGREFLLELCYILQSLLSVIINLLV